MIFIELIQWCRSSNTPANTVDWIEIELSRTTEEQIESGILKDKADGIERQWWKEDGCKKMERCETKKGQSIWRKFDVENVRMSWKVWDMTGRKEVWCSLKQVCASLWHIVNHQATLILTKQQLKKEDKKERKWFALLAPATHTGFGWKNGCVTGKPGLFKEWAPVFLSVLIANQVSIHSITNDYSDPIRIGR